MTLDRELRRRQPTDKQLGQLWDIAEQHSERLQRLEVSERDRGLVSHVWPAETHRSWRTLPRSIPPYIRRHGGTVFSSGLGCLIVLILQEVLRLLTAMGR